MVIAVATACLALISSRGRRRRSRATIPNTGALHFTGGIDQASVYVFRGFVQEQDPKLTVFPYGDLAIALTSGEGFVRSTVVNVGVWNSLNTGSSGTDGPSGHLHYEEEFYARLNWLFKGGFAAGVGIHGSDESEQHVRYAERIAAEGRESRQAESVRVSRVGADTERTADNGYPEGHLS